MRITNFIFCIPESAVVMSAVKLERQIALTSKLKTVGQASTAPNPIILRYHFDTFVIKG